MYNYFIFSKEKSYFYILTVILCNFMCVIYKDWKGSFMQAVI